MAMYALENQEQLGSSDIETAYALSAPWAAGVGTVSVIPLTTQFSLIELCSSYQTVASIEVFIHKILSSPLETLQC